MMQDIIKSSIKRFDAIATMTAITVNGSFMFIIYSLVTRDIPSHNKEVLVHVLGILDGAVMLVVGYYFGASKKQKEETITTEKTETIKE
jgi:hypothetical protein